VLKGDEATELYALAEERGLVLLEASKTAFCPAFNHLITLVKSGTIGEVIDVRASLSKLTEGHLRELDATQAGGSMTELAPLPLLSIIKLFGKDYHDIQFFSKMKDGVDIFTKGIINYDHAVSTITLGLGVKTEGNLVISGTKGYVYVPAPWWLTDFFEVRYENQTLNKKYFYSYDGDGLRYELQEFASMIFNHRLSSYNLRRREISERYEKDSYCYRRNQRDR
jgi:predicted dehydrogenase